MSKPSEWDLIAWPSDDRESLQRYLDEFGKGSIKDEFPYDNWNLPRSPLPDQPLLYRDQGWQVMRKIMGSG